MAAAPLEQKGMVFLDSYNLILRNLLTDMTAEDAKQEPIDAKFMDFDNTEFHVSATPEEKNIVSVSMKTKCLKEILPMGAKAAADSLYGSMLQNEPESGYDITLKFDLNKLPSERTKFIEDVSQIRRNILGSPFQRCFEALAGGKSKTLKPMAINYRNHEVMALFPYEDRIMVYFNIVFEDETDRAIAYVFMQEFAEAQRRVNNAPGVTFYRDPPNELKKAAPSFKHHEEWTVGYLSFQVMKTQVEGQRLENAVTLFQGFRPYLHYHIKASKSYLHTRMRNRVSELLKVLNRANPAAEEAEKASSRRGTLTGKSFRRF